MGKYLDYEGLEYFYNNKVKPLSQQADLTNINNQLSILKKQMGYLSYNGIKYHYALLTSEDDKIGSGRGDIASWPSLNDGKLTQQQAVMQITRNGCYAELTILWQPGKDTAVKRIGEELTTYNTVHQPSALLEFPDDCIPAMPCRGYMNLHPAAYFYTDGGNRRLMIGGTMDKTRVDEPVEAHLYVSLKLPTYTA